MTSDGAIVVMHRQKESSDTIVVKKKKADFERVLDYLEYEILTGVLKPRERLVESDCMQRYDAKRSTVRKALKELAIKGFVRLHKNRGAAVADLCESEIQDIYSVRILLENYATDLIVKNVDQASLDKIKKFHAQFGEFVRENDFAGMLTTNIKFHQAIFRLCGNNVLTDLIDQLRTRSHLLRHYIWRQPGRLHKSVEEHAELIRAIENRDSGELKRINEKHITAGIAPYLADLWPRSNEVSGPSEKGG
jgi:DNA-binding GntR family transcriptional regulator